MKIFVDGGILLLLLQSHLDNPSVNFFFCIGKKLKTILFKL